MDTLAACPTCQATTRQIKSGANHSGSPRRHCKHCRRTYTPDPKEHGYAPTLRHQALTLYLEAANFRRIGRLLHVHHQTIVNWIDAAAARLPSPATPSQQRRQPPVDTLEMDELYTFIGQKKSRPSS